MHSYLDPTCVRAALASNRKAVGGDEPPIMDSLLTTPAEHHSSPSPKKRVVGPEVAVTTTTVASSGNKRVVGPEVAAATATALAETRAATTTDTARPEVSATTTTAASSGNKRAATTNDTRSSESWDSRSMQHNTTAKAAAAPTAMGPSTTTSSALPLTSSAAALQASTDESAGEERPQKRVKAVHFSPIGSASSAARSIANGDDNDDDSAFAAHAKVLRAVPAALDFMFEKIKSLEEHVATLVARENNVKANARRSEQLVADQLSKFAAMSSVMMELQARVSSAAVFEPSRST
jgi:hypothetical protein